MAQRPDDYHAAVDLINEYVHAGWRIAEAAREGTSIDAIIDQHENECVEFIGKLGIAREILKAEGESKLRCPNDRHDSLNLDQCRDTWLPRLGRLLVEGRRIGDLKNVFENLTIITFNYDRCIEHCLPYSLVSHYGIGLPEARTLVSEQLCIYHPFGTVGRLPWWQGDGRVVPFGHPDPDLVGVSGQIRTFTEQLEDPVTLGAMRHAIENSQRIVCLGFAYHRQNLDLLKISGRTLQSDAFGTVKGISKYDRQVVQVELADAVNVAPERINLLDVSCSELFDENWRSLTS